MSRVGKKPITLSEGVTFKHENNIVTVKGPKGELSRYVDPAIEVEANDGEVQLKRSSDAKQQRAIHGLYRALIANMVNGVSQGFEKKLEIRGVGYRAEMRGKYLSLQIGYSHPIVFGPPENIEIKCENQTSISISGIDKELVGQVAAKIRSFRKPEPYKGKGIRYVGEYVREKAGKTAGK